jgi:hypothetical protein
MLIGLFSCLCFSSCLNPPISESNNALIVTGSTNTDIAKKVTLYKISVYDSYGNIRSAIGYKAKLGAFEIGDTVVIVKK